MAARPPAERVAASAAELQVPRASPTAHVESRPPLSRALPSQCRLSARAATNCAASRARGGAARRSSRSRRRSDGVHRDALARRRAGGVGTMGPRRWPRCAATRGGIALEPPAPAGDAEGDLAAAPEKARGARLRCAPCGGARGAGRGASSSRRAAAFSNRRRTRWGRAEQRLAIDFSACAAAASRRGNSRRGGARAGLSRGELCAAKATGRAGADPGAGRAFRRRSARRVAAHGLRRARKQDARRRGREWRFRRRLCARQSARGGRPTDYAACLPVTRAAAQRRGAAELLRRLLQLPFWRLSQVTRWRTPLPRELQSPKQGQQRCR